MLFNLALLVRATVPLGFFTLKAPRPPPSLVPSNASSRPLGHACARTGPNGRRSPRPGAGPHAPTRLDDLLGMIGFLGDQVAKIRPEPVRHDRPEQCRPTSGLSRTLTIHAGFRKPVADGVRSATLLMPAEYSVAFEHSECLAGAGAARRAYTLYCANINKVPTATCQCTLTSLSIAAPSTILART